MRKLSDHEVQILAETLTNQHRSEWCDLVKSACVGRTMGAAARLFGRPRSWVQQHLRQSAVEAVTSHGVTPFDQLRRDDVETIVREFAPPEPSEECLFEFAAEGYTSEVAKCLATARQAAEKALALGAIDESGLRQSEKAYEQVASILTDAEVDPSQQAVCDSSEFAVELGRHVARLKSFARFLDQAKISHLQQGETCERVMAAHAKWMEQIERIENFHPTFECE